MSLGLDASGVGEFLGAVWDPTAEAGDAGGQAIKFANNDAGLLDQNGVRLPNTVTSGNGFAGDAGSGDTYPFSVQLPGGNAGQPGGYRFMDLAFGDFAAGESFTFGIDVDPQSIQGASGTGQAGAVSGAEIAGTTVTITFEEVATGRTVTETRSLVSTGLNGSQAVFDEAPLGAAPTLDLVGLTEGGARRVIDPDTTQTVSVAGLAAGQWARLYVFDASGYEKHGGNGTESAPQDPFHANQLDAAPTVIEVQADATGIATFTDLALTDAPGANPATVDGLFFFSAVGLDGPGGAVATDTSQPAQLKIGEPITGDTTGAVTEAGGVLNGTPGLPTAAGDLDAAAGSPDVWTAGVQQGTYGSLTLAADGTWTYDLDDALPATEALDAGDTATDAFTVATADGAETQVIVTVTGAADAAVITGTTTGAVAEAGGVANGTAGEPTATGNLDSTDVDEDDAADAWADGVQQGTYGSLTLAADGTWTYDLDDTLPATEALTDGEVQTETFTVATVDGTETQIVIEVTGAGDAAEITGDTTGAVTEAGGVANGEPGTPEATGDLNSTDVDGDDDVWADGVQTGAYGSFALQTDGTWTYTLDNSLPATEALEDGETVTDSFTVATADGTEAQVAVTVTGAADEPESGPPVIDEVNSDIDLTIEEDGVFSGAIIATDPDEGDTLTYLAGSGTNGSVLINSATGTFTYTPDENFSGADSFSVAVTDSTLQTDTVTVNVNVTPVDDLMAMDDTFVILGSNGVFSEDVSTNDTTTSGGTLTYKVEDLPASGALLLNDDGKFFYTPVLEATNDSFTYTVTDADAGESETVSVDLILADTLLVENEVDPAAYGNNFRGANDDDGRVRAVFQGGTSDKILTLDAFDIDFDSTEIEVFLNGDSIGFLQGDNEQVVGNTLLIGQDDQSTGLNTLDFVQTQNPNFKWGIENLKLHTIDGTLTSGVTDTASYGNNFKGATNDDGVLAFALQSDGMGGVLEFDAFDIDFNNNEVELFLNGVSMGMVTGANEQIVANSFQFGAANMVDGMNLVEFHQTRNPNFKWGVENLTFTEGAFEGDTLVFEVVEERLFGNRLDAPGGKVTVVEADGTAAFGFAGIDEDLTLSVVSYDIDRNDEVEVLLNGDSIGFLSGANNAFADNTMTIEAEDMQAGTNVLSFNQTVNNNWRWGVTDIELTPETDGFAFL